MHLRYKPCSLQRYRHNRMPDLPIEILGEVFRLFVL